MTISVSPAELGDGGVSAAFRSFLLGILPSGTDVQLGQENRVPEPSAPDFVIYWPTLRGRIETNVDQFVDCRFQATITNATMNVTAVSYGKIQGRQRDIRGGAGDADDRDGLRNWKRRPRWSTN